MTTSLSPSFNSIFSVLEDIEDLRMRFRDLWYLRNRIKAFGLLLAKTATSRVTEVDGADPSSLYSFAMTDLLPLRIEGVSEHLHERDANVGALMAYLDMLAADTCRRILRSGNREEVAEAVIHGLDELHAYVLAHELVDHAYASAEQEFAERMGVTGDAPTVESATAEPVVASSSAEVPPAAENHLALAA